MVAHLSAIPVLHVLDSILDLASVLEFGQHIVEAAEDTNTEEKVVRVQEQDLEL